MSPRRDGSLYRMPLITAHLSISLDGFVAGPEQSEQNPIGVGGMELHRWHIGELEHDADRRMSDRLMAPRGAYVMGRNMFGPVRGDWGASDWRGWWVRAAVPRAVFVLTHYPHEPIPMEGGTTFYFVDDFDSAVKQAVAAAGTRPSPSPGARARSGRACSAGSWTRSCSATPRSCSVAVSGSSTASPS